MTALQRSKTAASVRAAEMRVWLCAGALVLAGCGEDSPAPDAALSDTAGAAVVEAPAPAPAVALLDGTDMPIEAFRGGWLFVNYWAEWCAPCRAIAPIVKELAGEYEGKVRIVKMNIDDNRQVATQFGIMSIPTVLLFKDGEVRNTFVGLSGKDKFAGALDELL